MENKKLVYINGKFLPENEAVISIFDRGFLYGDGVFETMRSYGGRIFKLLEHMRRLHQSAELIKLRLNLSDAQLTDICNQTLERNHSADAIIRISLTRGRSLGGIGTTKVAEPTIAAFIRPPPPIPATVFSEGASIIISSIMKTPSRALDSRVKSMNFLNLILARSEAEEAGAFEAVLLDHNNSVTETSTGNIFFVRDKCLFTPGPENDILLGITREAVLELAEQQGRKVVQGPIPASDIETFEECFLTNSAIELLPVTRIGAGPVGSARVGPVFRELRRAYENLVRKII